MNNIVYLIKFIPPFIAALILGHWLHKEVRKARALGRPWYTPYLSTPGILIIVILATLIGVRVIMF